MLRQSCLGAMVLAAMGLSAAESTPLEYELSDPMLAIRLHNTTRSVERYKAGPYSAFVTTPTGAMLQGQILMGLSMAGGGDPTLIPKGVGAIEALNFTLKLNRGEWGPSPQMQVAAKVSDSAAVLALLGKASPTVKIEGAAVPSWKITGTDDVLIEQHDKVLVLAAADRGKVAISKSAKPANPLDAKADLEISLNLGQILESAGMMLAMVPNAEAIKDFLKDSSFTTTLKLSANGLDEKSTIALPAMMAKLDPATLKLMQGCTVSKKAFDRLGANTLWAVAGHSSKALTEKVMASMDPQMLNNPGIAEIDAELAKLGLPKYLDLCASLDGEYVIALESAGSGRPAILVEVQMDAAVGPKLAELANTKLAEAMAKEKAPAELVAVLGYEPKPVFAYKNGTMQIAVHPDGLKAFDARQKGGFVALPNIKAALATMPESAISLGLSNSPESWRMMAGLILKGMQQNKSTAAFSMVLSTLPDDLAKVAKVGSMVTTLKADNSMEIQSSGMITPVPGYAGMIAGVIAFSIAQAKSRMSGGDEVPPAAF